jgi:selenocysteine-specific elongation factor
MIVFERDFRSARDRHTLMVKKHFILGTAGHVDHGKTELVKALTGWDTDRLKEEKQRGISIELGFAPLPLGDDIMIGIVDVPGHERFVKNMVAGAGGIDLAILVIAADEGVMPQTREHLEVLDSLAIKAGVVVVTKSDLATEDMRVLLLDEIQDLVRDTFLRGAEVIATSARTGEGIDALKAALVRLAAAVTEKDSGGPFRLAVDRVFHKKGLGVVITGSCYSGTVSTGDSLAILPSEKSARVREIQSFGEKRSSGHAGERLAIALQGIRLSDISRGDMLVTPSRFTVAHLIDARIHIADYARFELKQRERIRIHHGAREVLGRVVLLDGDRLESGNQALVQLRLETPIVAAEGDYFVIRKYSPPRVLGGGRVVDPHAKKHRAGDDTALANLQLRETGDPRTRALKAIEAAGLDGVAESACDAGECARLTSEGTIVTIDGRYVLVERLRELARTVHDLAAEHGRSHPLRPGIDKEELKQKVAFKQPTSLFNHVLDKLAEYEKIFVRESFVRADTPDMQLDDAAARDVRALETAIEAAGLVFPRQGDLERQWKGKHAFGEVLQHLRDARRVFKVGTDGYVHRTAMAKCLRALDAWFQKNDTLSVPDFKDMVAITRKHAIPWLEYFDNARVTLREENVRRRGPRLADALREVSNAAP